MYLGLVKNEKRNPPLSFPVVRTLYLVVCLFLSCNLSLLHAWQAQPRAASVRTASKTDAPAPATAGDWRAALVANSAASVTIVEFFDYQCPFCAKANPVLDAAIRNHPGQVRLVLKNVPLPMHPDAKLAHQAALAAGEQGRFWEMHDLLFANQRNLKPADLIGYAERLHLDVPKFRQRLDSGYFRRTVEDELAAALAQGIEATPSYSINGKPLVVGVQSLERFNDLIDSALNPGRPAAPALARLSPSDLDIARAPALGRPDAPVVIIEFSDLQCPFCAKIAPTLRELLKQYPDQIRWVFKNFPLDMHPDAPLAHMAAMAAARQGRFWEMHDLIFDGKRNLKKENLLVEARSLNLDMARFTADLESAEIRKQVEADLLEGKRLGIEGTPEFFVNGRPLSGARPLEQFQVLINSELARLGKPIPATAVPPAPRLAAGQPQTKPSDTRKAPDGKAIEISLGSPASPVTLVWFSDLQSGLSLNATLLVRHVIETHPGKIRLVFRNRPLETHPEAMLLHEAAMAANAQGKFWQMHDLIVANPQKATRRDLLAYAQRIGLDTERFKKDVDSGAWRPQIEADILEAQRRSVLGSPVFFLNSARIDGLRDEKYFNDLIAGQLAAKR